MRHLFTWFVKLTAWIPQLIVFRTKIYYEDRRVQSRRIRGKAIIASNHHYITDFAVMMFVFPLRLLRCLVAELMFEKNFFMNIFLKGMGCIRVERGSHDFSFLERSRRVLDKGGVIEVYPEARIPRKGEEKPLAFTPSTVYLALETDTPIIPVYTNGKQFAKERCRVIIGKPIDVRGMYDPSLAEKENIDNITTYLRGKIIELGKELERQKGEEK